MNRLDQWLEVSAALKEAKEREKELRIEILEDFFPNAIEGTMNELDGEYIIKGSFKLSHKLNAKKLDAISKALTIEEENCIKWTPTLIMANYKELSEDERLNLDACVTVSPALPTLKISVASDED